MKNTGVSRTKVRFLITNKEKENIESRDKMKISKEKQNKLKKEKKSE